MELVKALLDTGADVNTKLPQYNWRGCGLTETPFEIMPCFTQKNPSLLEAFLEKGADPNVEQKSHRHSMRTDGFTSSTPLHTAVRRKGVQNAQRAWPQ